MLGLEAINKIIHKKEIKSLLDIGSGSGEHANKFSDSGIDVTAVDIRPRPAILYDKITYLKGFLKDFLPLQSYDCVWSCHVLEHVLDVQTFILEMVNCCEENGWISITVPPLKNDIVGGHVNLFNAGIILYRLVLAGLDVSNAMVKKYDYNISVIVKKKKITDDFFKKLVFDRGDIELLSKYFPPTLNYHGFNGDIDSLNWD